MPSTEPQPSDDVWRLCGATIEEAPWPLAMVDAAERVVRYVNPGLCRLLSADRQDLIGKPLGAVMAGQTGCLALVDRVCRTGEPESATEPDAATPDPLLWSYTVWPVRGAGARVTGVMLQVTETMTFHQRSAEMSEALMLGLVRQHELVEAADVVNAELQIEIAARKQNEDALQRARAQLADRAVHLQALVADRTGALRETVEELEAVSYGIVHHMRAPLRSMASFARLVQIEHGQQLDETGRELLGRVVASAQRLNELVTDVLSYSAMARRQLELRPVDVQRLLEEVMRDHAEFRTSDVEVIIRPPLHPVIGHEAALMQCLSNLLSNAVKFVAPGVLPRIAVWSEVVESDVRLWIEDNGIGVAAADASRIFALFERVHPVAEFVGTGVGLSIVRKAVERMNGTVGVESEAGKGSRFWIRLRKSGDA